MPGVLEKVCPHSSTGRADYFGSTVNRAARLLLAAKPGQILVEAPAMDKVLQEWAGDVVELQCCRSSSLNAGHYRLP